MQHQILQLAVAWAPLPCSPSLCSAVTATLYPNPTPKTQDPIRYQSLWNYKKDDVTKLSRNSETLWLECCQDVQHESGSQAAWSSTSPDKITLWSRFLIVSSWFLSLLYFVAFFFSVAQVGGLWRVRVRVCLAKWTRASRGACSCGWRSRALRHLARAHARYETFLLLTCIFHDSPYPIGYSSNGH